MIFDNIDENIGKRKNWGKYTISNSKHEFSSTRVN